MISFVFVSFLSELLCNFFFSDLVVIDETLFSSSLPPDGALPLYLGHFQFDYNSEKEVPVTLCFIILSLDIVCIS